MFNSDMMGQMQEMKQQMEDMKKKLDTISVKGEDPEGKVVVTASANREIRSIEISETLKNGDKEELEDTILVATNRALQEAEKVQESEMQGQAGQMMPFLKNMGL